MRALALLLLLAACRDPKKVPGPDAPPADFQLGFEPVALDGERRAVTDSVFIPGTNEVLLLEKEARVSHHLVGEAATTLLGQFELPDVYWGSDCGLLSIALDPGFADNHLFYTGACVDETTSRIMRYTFDPADYAGIAASGVEILSNGHPDAEEPWHNIGSLGFDDDGVLWALFGEKTVAGTSQDPASPLGALVRLIPGREPGAGGYTVPDGNMSGAHPLVYAKGLRSPWKGFRDGAGRFWVGDVGAAVTEEVDVVTAAGQNFGWPLYEGDCLYDCDGLKNPLRSWDRQADHEFALDDLDTPPTTRRVVWVGGEYRDEGLDRYDHALTGRATYGDFCAGWVRVAELDDDEALILDGNVGHLSGITDWEQAGDGFIYVTVYGSCQTNPHPVSSYFRVTLQ